MTGDCFDCLDPFKKKELLEKAQVHAERAQVARRNVMSARSKEKMDIFKSIEEKESGIANDLMRQAGVGN